MIGNWFLRPINHNGYIRVKSASDILMLFICSFSLPIYIFLIVFSFTMFEAILFLCTVFFSFLIFFFFFFFNTPEGRQWISDVYLLSGTSGLTLDSPFLSSLLSLCPILLFFLFSKKICQWPFLPTFFQNFFLYGSC